MLFNSASSYFSPIEGTFSRASVVIKDTFQKDDRNGVLEKSKMAILGLYVMEEGKMGLP